MRNLLNFKKKNKHFCQETLVVVVLRGKNSKSAKNQNVKMRKFTGVLSL